MGSKVITCNNNFLGVQRVACRKCYYWFYKKYGLHNLSLMYFYSSLRILIWVLSWGRREAPLWLRLLPEIGSGGLDSLKRTGKQSTGNTGEVNTHAHTHTYTHTHTHTTIIILTIVITFPTGKNLLGEILTEVREELDWHSNCSFCYRISVILSDKMIFVSCARMHHAHN